MSSCHRSPVSSLSCHHRTSHLSYVLAVVVTTIIILPWRWAHISACGCCPHSIAALHCCCHAVMALAIYIMPLSSCRPDTCHLCHIVVVVVVVVIVVAAVAPVSRHWSYCQYSIMALTKHITLSSSPSLDSPHVIKRCLTLSITGGDRVCVKSGWIQWACTGVVIVVQKKTLHQKQVSQSRENENKNKPSIYGHPLEGE